MKKNTNSLFYFVAFYFISLFLTGCFASDNKKNEEISPKTSSKNDENESKSIEKENKKIHKWYQSISTC